MSQMYSETTFGAPWGVSLALWTAFSVLVLAGVVVLRFAGRTIVITPDRPDEFVADTRERLGLEEEP